MLLRVFLHSKRWRVSNEKLCTGLRFLQRHRCSSQGFHWESHWQHGGIGTWNALRQKVPEIAAAGFTVVWLPPPSDSLSPQGKGVS